LKIKNISIFIFLPMVSIGPITTCYTNMSRQEYGEWLRNGGRSRSREPDPLPTRRAIHTPGSNVKTIRATDMHTELRDFLHMDLDKPETRAAIKEMMDQQWKGRCSMALQAYGTDPTWALRFVSHCQEDIDVAMRLSAEAGSMICCKLLFEVEPPSPSAPAPPAPSAPAARL